MLLDECVCDVDLLWQPSVRDQRRETAEGDTSMVKIFHYCKT